MAASSSISFSQLFASTNNHSLYKPKVPKFQVRSQSLRDEGGSANNMVDANMKVLRARIEEVMRKENLLANKMEAIGWKYDQKQHKKCHASVFFMETMELLGLVGGSLGLVFLFGSLSIFLVSFLVHLHT